MYVPPQFRQDDRDAVRAFLGASRLATLVTVGPGGPRASHLPMEYDPEPAPYGTLRAHLARANEQWRDLASGVEALVVFLGPEAYVNPTFYASKREHGRVVPTWNYIAVHAYGTPTVSDDANVLHDLVRSLTDDREAPRAESWHVDDAPADYVEKQVRGIVAVTIPIARWDAAWKLGQHRSEADVAGVVRGLEASAVSSERDTAAATAALLERRRATPGA